MDDTSAVSQTRVRVPALSRVPIVRLFHQPGGRRRLAAIAAIAAGTVYGVRAIQQLAGLGGEALRWDFVQFRQAAVDLNAGQNPYAAFLSACPGIHWCPGGYIFPPLLAEFLRPLALLSLPMGAAAWLVLSHALLLVGCWVTWRTIRAWVSPTTGLVLLAATLLFLPLYQSLYFLQVGILLALLLAVAARQAVLGKAAAAGAWLGLASVLRVTPLLVAPALIGRRAGARAGGRGWRGLAAVVLVGGGILAILAVLTPATISYFTDVLPRIGAATDNLDNQSPTGLVLRAVSLTGGGSFEAVSRVSTVALITLVLVPTWLLTRRLPDAGPARAASFAAFLAAMPLVSSITWQHHLVSELLVLALVAPALSLDRTGSRAGVVRLAVAGYLLTWVDRHVTTLLVIDLGLRNPAGWKVAPFLVLTALNVAGIVCIWVAAVMAVRLTRSGVERVDLDPVVVVDETEPAHP